MSQGTTQGNAATDFQPTTQNPQGNVGGGLQPNSATLQPVSTSNGSNVFNQPGINPQAFPQTTSLKVANSQGSSIVVSTPDKPTNATGWGMFLWFFIALVVVIIGLVFAVKFARPANSIQETKAVEPVPVIDNPKPKKKSKNKKKSHKKRKK